MRLTLISIAEQELTPEILGELQVDGARLVTSAGGFRLAAHEIQEINMRKRADIRASITRQRHLLQLLQINLGGFSGLGRTRHLPKCENT